MSRSKLFLLGIAAAASGASAQQPDPVFGLWHNPKNSVQVRTEPCAAGLCGRIVHATEKAQADARNKGVNTLVGTQLFRDYTRDDDGRGWSGRLFVPDRGRTVSSRIVLVGRDQLRISGCIVAGLLCKSQVWSRVQ